MKHIIGYLKKYWYYILAVLLLLLVQSYCDLSLPDYTSKIIDVGISSSGMEHIVPEYMTEDSFDSLCQFLDDEEKADLEDAFSYNEEKGCYVLKDTSSGTWDALDEEFKSPIAVVYMMSQQMSGTDSPDLSALSDLGINLLSPTLKQDIREKMEEKLSALGDSALTSYGRLFAKSEYEACGIDINKMQTDYMWRIGAKMLAMALILAIAAIATGYFASKTGAGVGRDLRSRMFTKVMGFSSAELDNFSTASLITRTTNDVQQIQIVTVLLLRMVLYAPILAIGGIVNIRRYKSGMSWVIVLAIALIACIILALLLVAMPKFQKMQDLIDDVNLVAREILTGIPVIRAFSREKFEEKHFDGANTRLMDVALFVNRVMAVLMPAMMFVMNGVSVLIIWVASRKIDSGVMQVGTMTAFITYAMLIIMSFLMLTLLSIMLPRAIVSANRIDAVLKTPDRIVDIPDASREEAAECSIAFEHVSFAYPDSKENAIADIDFVAKQGQTTAIIGSTGCGKSTLVNLIPRFYDVTEGRITLGGVDIRDIALDTLRGQIGYVPQKGILFSGTIQSNIGYGSKDTSMENIIDAAQISQSCDFIEEKKDGYQSEIAQGGSNVSGGQKQRLSIARAIARKPKIYIFDDSFSALDFKTDAALRRALKARTQNAAVLIVAQRISTILHAEQIIVLEDGKMVGKGTHKELVENCEVYRQIAKSQLSEEEFSRSIGKAGKEDA